MNTVIKKLNQRLKKRFTFSKAFTTAISKDIFNKIKKTVLTKEVTTFQKKDTPNNFVYDFILKENTNIDNLSFGIKHINIYEIPVNCNTF